MKMKLYALTLWQPWASLVMGGWKPYEFRPYAAPKWLAGHRIVIHAGKRPIVAGEIDLLVNDLLSGRNCGGLDPACVPWLQSWRSRPGSLPYSAGLGTVLLGKSVLSSELWPGEFANDSDRIDKANWALPVSDPQPFTPIVPARGFQKFWTWSAGRRP
jgi:hypothetical protein